jgi:hypothetical protein
LLESAHPAWLSVFPYGHSSFDWVGVLEFETTFHSLKININNI